MKEIKKYISEDGKEFKTVKECKDYEQELYSQKSTAFNSQEFTMFLQDFSITKILDQATYLYIPNKKAELAFKKLCEKENCEEQFIAVIDDYGSAIGNFIWYDPMCCYLKAEVAEQFKFNEAVSFFNDLTGDNIKTFEKSDNITLRQLTQLRLSSGFTIFPRTQEGKKTIPTFSSYEKDMMDKYANHKIIDIYSDCGLVVEID